MNLSADVCQPQIVFIGPHWISRHFWTNERRSVGFIFYSLFVTYTHTLGYCSCMRSSLHLVHAHSQNWETWHHEKAVYLSLCAIVCISVCVCCLFLTSRSCRRRRRRRETRVSRERESVDERRTTNGDSAKVSEHIFLNFNFCSEYWKHTCTSLVRIKFRHDRLLIESNCLWRLAVI